MTKDELATIGRGLFGPAWKGKLAAEMGRSRFTVYRWAAGNPIPAPAVTRIRHLAEQHEAKEGL